MRSSATPPFPGDRPVVAAAAAFAAGIAAMDAPSAAALLVATLCAVGARARGGARYSLILCAAFAALGATRGCTAARPAADDIARLAEHGYLDIVAVATDDATVRGGAAIVAVDVESAVLADGRAVSCSGIAGCILPIRPAEPVPAAGDRLRIHARVERLTGPRLPEGYDAASAGRRHGVFARLKVRRPSSWSIARAAPLDARDPASLARMCRRSFERMLERTLPPIEAGLVSGIVLGGHSGLPPALSDDFAVTGTSHLLAASGMNVMLFAAGVTLLLRRTFFSARAIAALTIVGIALYAAAAGCEASVIRAAVMASLYLGAFLVDREPDAPSAVAASALILLIARPGDLLDAGFQLSYAVTIALIIWSSAGAAGRRGSFDRGIGARMWRSAVDWCAVSVVAQGAAAPLVAQHFNMLPLIGVLANVLVAAVVAPMMAIALLAWCASGLIPAAAHAAALILGPMAQYLIGVVHAFAGIPCSAMSVPPPGWPAVLAAYGLALATTARIAGRRRSPGGLAE